MKSYKRLFSSLSKQGWKIYSLQGDYVFLERNRKKGEVCCIDLSSKRVYKTGGKGKTFSSLETLLIKKILEECGF